MGLRRPDLEEARREKLAPLRRLHSLVELSKNFGDQDDDIEKARKLLANACLPEAEYSAMARDFLDSDRSSTRDE